MAAQRPPHFRLRNVGALKTILKNALGTVEPDFPEAVATHAEMSRPIGATRQGYATANQLLRGTTAAKNLGNAVKDPAAFLARTVPTMTPDLAEQTLGGVLGRTQQNLGLSVNPLSGFGIGRSAMAINRVSPPGRCVGCAEWQHIASRGSADGTRAIGRTPRRGATMTVAQVAVAVVNDSDFLALGRRKR